MALLERLAGAATWVRIRLRDGREADFLPHEVVRRDAPGLTMLLVIGLERMQESDEWEAQCFPLFEIDSLVPLPVAPDVARPERAQGGETAHADGMQLIDTFDVDHYPCGMTAGQHVMSIQSISVPILADAGVELLTFASGTIWRVLRGSSQSPATVWLQPLGGPAIPFDNPDDIWEKFERSPSP